MKDLQHNNAPMPSERGATNEQILLQALRAHGDARKHASLDKFVLHESRQSHAASEEIMNTDVSGMRALWAAVLFQAVRDLDNEFFRMYKEDRQRPRTYGPAYWWVYSDREDAGSMRWICDMLDLDYHKLQHLCASRSGRNQILKRDKAVKSPRQPNKVRFNNEAA